MTTEELTVFRKTLEIISAALIYSTSDSMRFEYDEDTCIESAAKSFRQARAFDQLAEAPYIELINAINGDSDWGVTPKQDGNKIKPSDALTVIALLNLLPAGTEIVKPKNSDPSDHEVTWGVGYGGVKNSSRSLVTALRTFLKSMNVTYDA